MIIGCAMGSTFRSPFTAIFVGKPFPPSLIEGGIGVVAIFEGCVEAHSASNCPSMSFHFPMCLATAFCGTFSQK